MAEHQLGTCGLPLLFPYERERVLRGNVADVSAIAHRAGLREAHFDPDLREMRDWDSSSASRGTRTRSCSR